MEEIKCCKCKKELNPGENAILFSRVFTEEYGQTVSIRRYLCYDCEVEVSRFIGLING